MHVADVGIAHPTVARTDGIDQRHASRDPSADRRETAVQADVRPSRESQTVVYGELLPRAADLAGDKIPGAHRLAPGEPAGSATRAVLSHAGHRQAIDIYETLQTHATAQVLSPVYRIDLYA